MPWAVVALLLAAVVGIGAFFFLRGPHSSSPPPITQAVAKPTAAPEKSIAAPEKSIAVLPFDNLSVTRPMPTSPKAFKMKS